MRRSSGAQRRDGDRVGFVRSSNRRPSYDLLRNGRWEFHRGIDPCANVRLEHLPGHQHGDDRRADGAPHREPRTPLQAFEVRGFSSIHDQEVSASVALRRAQPRNGAALPEPRAGGGHNRAVSVEKRMREKRRPYP
jgi:hypothetical protein